MAHLVEVQRSVIMRRDAGAILVLVHQAVVGRLSRAVHPRCHKPVHNRLQKRWQRLRQADMDQPLTAI